MWPTDKSRKPKGLSLKEQPAQKKRKIEEQIEGDDWDDDSFELTQAEINELDVIASQVIL